MKLSGIVAISTSVAILVFLSTPAVAQSPWRQITMPTVREAAASFAKPPREYGAIHWAIWGGQQSKERILADIERIDANGGGVYMINNSRGLRPKYFTPEYLDLVKFVVEECKKRGMKVWIEGDDGYPDGFAGGMISRDYPALGHAGHRRRRALHGRRRPDAQNSAAPRYTGHPGQSPCVNAWGWGGDARCRDVNGGFNADAPAAQRVLPLPADGQFQWTAPGPGTWEVTFVRHVYRSSPTRYDNREDGTRRQGQPLLADRLSRSRGHRHLYQAHSRNLRESSSATSSAKPSSASAATRPTTPASCPGRPSCSKPFKRKKATTSNPTSPSSSPAR